RLRRHALSGADPGPTDQPARPALWLAGPDFGSGRLPGRVCRPFCLDRLAQPDARHQLAPAGLAAAVAGRGGGRRTAFRLCAATPAATVQGADLARAAPRTG